MEQVCAAVDERFTAVVHAYRYAISCCILILSQALAREEAAASHMQGVLTIDSVTAGAALARPDDCL
jgi:hypothetical protein